MASLSSAAVAFAVVLVSAVAPAVLAQSPASAPTPAATSDGTSIDQGIAYVLMAVALVLTYLIHSSSSTAWN
ncbi:arabinogalactan protein 22-like [Zingiber officinale]|uniref:Uncharacterized protein n=1 Tax=Zingiber officinale TaxID=94328 RepID=A0A8J5LJS4_ZINOF|nr:arabinogalactan protein 22-like [Zingiber officinale]XP_042466515.1 arabinogalactan protein 22-like [Zingiber officinale]KAG6527896.1 hypothetical protein ZIOFF_010030 [Zingiber officinale]